MSLATRTVSPGLFWGFRRADSFEQAAEDRQSGFCAILMPKLHPDKHAGKPAAAAIGDWRLAVGGWPLTVRRSLFDSGRTEKSAILSMDHGKKIPGKTQARKHR
jgi:hypothetical protein